MLMMMIIIVSVKAHQEERALGKFHVKHLNPSAKNGYLNTCNYITV